MAQQTEISDDWEAQIMAGWDKLASEHLGPDIAKDAKRYCPVDTGALKESIEDHMEGHDLIVSATGGADGRTYAAYVELGTRPHIIRAHGNYSLHNWRTGQYFGPLVHHPGTRAQAFLRPALYQIRGE